MDYSYAKSGGFNNQSKYNNNYLKPQQGTPGKYSQSNTNTFGNKDNKDKSFSGTESDFLARALSSDKDSLIISNNIIPNEEWDSIGTHLMKSPYIHTIELSGININGFGLRSLAEAIQRSSGIKNIKLEWNYLNEYTEDFDYFCDVISSVTSLVNVT